MTKAMDRANEKRRVKALESDNPEPFYKQFFDWQLACPYCGDFLRVRYFHADKECGCSFWTYDLVPTLHWKRVQKSKSNMLR